jgi:hypothetical protein
MPVRNRFIDRGVISGQNLEGNPRPRPSETSACDSDTLEYDSSQIAHLCAEAARLQRLGPDRDVAFDEQLTLNLRRDKHHGGKLGLQRNRDASMDL